MAERFNEPAEEEPIRIDGGEEEVLPVLDDLPGSVKTREKAPAEEEQAEPEEPIKLVDDDETAGEAMRTIGVAGGPGVRKAERKRPLNVNGTGATRCRLFHSRIQLSSLEHMEEQINAWLDSQKIEVKHVGHVIGVMEGKRPEPNVMVFVWV